MAAGGLGESGAGSRATPDGVLDLFLELVRIDSPTREEGELAAFCEQKLADLGFAVQRDDSACITGSNTGNLIARLPGTVDKTLLLCAHMDCVEPCRGVVPVVAEGRVSSAGKTVLGADDKVGIAAIITAARDSILAGGPRPTLQVILTVQEEIGLRGAKAVDPEELHADLCLVLDAEGAPGTLIVAAPTHYTFVATFEGRSCHAGVAPEEGLNAILMAARAIDSMELGRLDDETTANVGSIEGGSATNVVPDRVTITGECRSLDRPRVEHVKSSMDTAMHDAAEAMGGRVTVEWTREYESYAIAEDDPALLLVTKACRDACLAPVYKRTGGGADSNVFAARGVPTLALSCGMTSVHCTEESVAVEDLDALTRLVLAVIERMAE